VPVGPVRFLVVLTTLFTGVVPGLMLYGLAAFLHTDHARRKLGRFARSLDEIRHDVPGASDRAASWSTPGPGPRRIGRYRIVGELGRGGMGTVYRGRDEALHRDAAVKVIRPLPGEDAGALGRFGEEARAAASLASPHIVQIYEFDPAARPPFMAMELVPGSSIQQIVKGRGALPAATVIDCALQVLDGLATAHAAGIVHRDIKPANILLATTGPAAGTYKLTDFGLARSPDRQHTLTASGSLLGTLTYLAPEVALGDEATAASDLYSLGATLHEMLTGRPPLSADSPLKLLRKITTETIPSLLPLRPDLPADFVAWLDRLIAPVPADRFRSAAQARAALAGLPVAAGAFTDIRGQVPDGPALPPPLPDTVPWHLRGTHDTDRFRGASALDSAERVRERAGALESAGRDLLGEQTVTDIARELNLDAGQVRAILRAHRQGRGRAGRNVDSVAGFFGAALGRRDPPGEDVDRWKFSHARFDDRKMRRRRVGGILAALISIGIGVGALLSIGTARRGIQLAPEVAPPRPVVIMPNDFGPPKLAPELPKIEAELDSAALHDTLPGQPPQLSPPSPFPFAASAPPLAPPPRDAFRARAVPTGVGIALIFSFGFAIALVWGAIRRRHGRNWP
jgi:serine/threonine-protein kinase